MGYDGPIDINHIPIWQAIDHFPESIKDKWVCFEKVLIMANKAMSGVKDTNGENA